MSVFRFQASPSSSKSIPKRTKGKAKESQWPTFAFSTSPSLLQDITLEKVAENNVDVDDSCDSSSDMIKPDYAEGANYDSQVESGSESQVDFEVGMRNSASSGLTMKEYEEQLKKLTAENFNLKLRVYFVEERLSKVTGISDKEDLIKKNIQLKITCESQLKELEKKQELLFEASKAFELLQKEHSEKLDKLMKEKDKEISDWEEKFIKLETIYNEIKAKFPALENLNNPDVEIKTFEDYEKQIADLASALRNQEVRNKDMENVVKDVQLELESYELKAQRMESEMNQRMHRTEELVDELEQKEHDLASANFRIRKLEDDVKAKQREVEIMKERIEEKNKTIESLKNSLASRYDTIESLENRVAKERSASQSMQSKLDGLSFQNVKLKEELEILQSRLRRTTEALSPRGKGWSIEDEAIKHKYEDLVRTMEEHEAQANKRIQELEEKLELKNLEGYEYQNLLEKHKKLEDDHRKACTALKNFIKRSSDEKKEREVLNHMLNNHEEVIADLKAQLDRYRNNSIPRIIPDDKLSLPKTGVYTAYLKHNVPDVETFYPENVVLMQNGNVAVQRKKDHMTQKEEKGSSGGEEVDEETEKKDKEEKEKEKGTREEDCAREWSDGGCLETYLTSEEKVSRQVLEKNCHIERLERRLAEICQANSMLEQEIEMRDHQLNVLQAKLKEVPCSTGSTPHLECKLLLGVEKTESLNSVLGGAAEEMNVWNLNHGDDESPVIRKENSRESERPRTCSAEKGTFQKDAVKVCTLLSMRLEELAAFLDSLLQNGHLLNGISLQKREDLRRAMERSRELSRHLSLSFTKKNLSDTALGWNISENCNDSTLSLPLISSSLVENSMSLQNKDKLISDQSFIIARLRDQLKLLNQEIKQRDIELSHCQGTEKRSFDDDMMDISDREGIEKQTMSICQELSDELDEEGKESPTEDCFPKDNRDKEPEKACRKISLVMGRKGTSMVDGSRDTSESDAWSEPDRSVSLARMGKLDDVASNPAHRAHKGDQSSDSSEETLNDSSKIPGKRCRSAESEIRRLQSKVKALDEANQDLRLEIRSLRRGKMNSGQSQKEEEEKEDKGDVNLGEKLRKTMDRLDECGLTCRQLEEKLAAALQRASASAVQLSKAAETISNLEEEINRLKEELGEKNGEVEKRNQRIVSLESKIEEMSMEGSLKLMEAKKHREAAERKVLELECRLKDAENMSRDAESKVEEFEKKMEESRKGKRESGVQTKEPVGEAGAAEKMMEEAEKVKMEAERKSKDFQNFIDLMRKEVEDKMKEAERRIKKSEKEKEELEKQVARLKKRLLEAERNKTEVERKVKEGKETIQCMEEKLRELEVAMDQCNDEAQKKIKEMQKKAETKIVELENKMEERERARKTDLEKKMADAEKISRELETGFRNQLEDSERKIRKAREAAEVALAKAQQDFNKQETELRQRINDIETEKKKQVTDLLRKLDQVKLEASEFELELTRVTNEKIQLEEELNRILNKESAFPKDNKQVKGKYDNSIHKLEEKLTQLTLNKSHLASRLEEIESTNIDLFSRISAIRGKEAKMTEREVTSTSLPAFSPPRHGSPLFFGDEVSDLEGGKLFLRQGSTASYPGDRPLAILSAEAFAPPRRTMNSSPDLGIESDPGRFSSLEANQPTGGDPRPPLGSSEPTEMRKLESENAELRRRLTRTRQALEETLTQLSAANQRKKQVERAICKQLHKTHHILKKARVNFESQDTGESLE